MEKSSTQTPNNHIVHESANLRGVSAIRKYGNITAVTTATPHDIRKVPIDQCGRTLTAGLEQFIVTVAGTGQPGYNLDNIAATSGKLYVPSGIKVDGTGDIFFVDNSNHRVRKVTVSTGIITTIAGTGAYGYNGDNIVATTAQLKDPTGIALDGLGNIYIADTYNCRVRKVTVSTGMITTIAGTENCGYNGDDIVATDAQLDSPAGVALDGIGNIYIADTFNSLVRIVTISTGRISSIDVSLDYPLGVALDGLGNIYIADTYHNRVIKVTVSTGIITTIADSDILFKPSDVALDGKGNVYIADTEHNRILKVAVSTGIITTIAGTGAYGYNGDNILATTAELALPAGVAVDEMGNVYIADSDNDRIRQLTSVKPTA